MSILQEILNERGRQDDKWGGPEHDDQHPLADFVDFIEGYAAKARDGDEPRRRLIQVAALAVAAVESMDRKSHQKNSQERLERLEKRIEFLEQQIIIHGCEVKS